MDFTIKIFYIFLHFSVLINGLEDNVNDILLSHCPIGFENMAPVSNKTGRINVTVYMQAIRLMEINDIDESFTITGVLTVIWNDSCSDKILNDEAKFKWPQMSKDQGQFLTLNPTRFWRPDFVHFNSVTQVSLLSDSFTRRMIIGKNGESVEYLYGKYESSCNLQFWSFPFDRYQLNISFQYSFSKMNFHSQTCSMEFRLFSDIQFLHFNHFDIAIAEAFIPDNSNWILEEKMASINETQFSISFNFQFRRKSRYFVVNLFCPGLILTFLEMASFLIPPDVPDRPAFTATIMLAMFLLHSQILSYLPKTSTPILASYYVLGVIFFAMICTIYAAVICFMANTKKFIVHKQIAQSKWNILELVELIAFMSASLIIFIFNFSCAYLIGLF